MSVDLKCPWRDALNNMYPVTLDICVLNINQNLGGNDKSFTLFIKRVQICF